MSEGNSELQDPWLLMLSAGTRQQHQQVAVSSGLYTVTITSDKSLNTRGPTYKAGVIVEVVKVRALLDHGAQVSLVRKELLPKIKEKNGWTLEECHDRNCKLEGQPTGAGRYELGAIAVVRLQVMTMDGEKQHQVPCYVLESSKPIWNGELKNCAMLLGTNVPGDLSFCIISNDGFKVMPEEVAEPSEQCDNSMKGRPSVAKPSDSTEDMANVLCDFQEMLWSGSTQFKIVFNNWGTEPLTLAEGQQVGSVDPTNIVPENDPLWEDTEAQVLLCQARTEAERSAEVKKQLQLGLDLTPQERDQMETMLLTQSDVFTLTDEELGETDFVSHSIDTGDARPIKALPRRLPYTYIKERT